MSIIPKAPNVSTERDNDTSDSTMRDASGKIIARREAHRSADGSITMVIRDANGTIIGREERHDHK